MADAKLSALAVRNALAGTDLVYVIAGGISYGATVDTVVSFARTNMYPQVATYADLPVSIGGGAINIVQSSTGVWPLRKYAGFWRDTGGGWVWLGNSTWVAGEIAFAPTGNIAATDVAAAIAELDTEKAPANPQIQSVVSAATVTPTFANDQVNITAQAAALALANPTGTAVDGWGIAIRIKDNGTARAINFDTQYRALGVILPTATIISKTLYLGLVFNAADTKWDVVAVAQEA